MRLFPLLLAAALCAPPRAATVDKSAPKLEPIAVERLVPPLFKSSGIEAFQLVAVGRLDERIPLTTTSTGIRFHSFCIPSSTEGIIEFIDEAGRPYPLCFAAVPDLRLLNRVNNLEAVLNVLLPPTKENALMRKKLREANLLSIAAIELDGGTSFGWKIAISYFDQGRLTGVEVSVNYNEGRKGRTEATPFDSLSVRSWTSVDLSKWK